MPHGKAEVQLTGNDQKLQEACKRGGERVEGFAAKTRARLNNKRPRPEAVVLGRPLRRGRERREPYSLSKVCG